MLFIILYYFNSELQPEFTKQMRRIKAREFSSFLSKEKQMQLASKWAKDKLSHTANYIANSEEEALAKFWESHDKTRVSINRVQTIH